MNKKVDEEFVGIKDYYVLQCICTELKDEIKNTIETLEFELQFQTGGCYNRISHLVENLKNKIGINKE